jgi:2-(1,2-epoxy-1,2-dihydrophenyl)acetyl-CoA isomerase
MEFASINFSIDDGVAHIRFNRPDSLNAFTRPMGLEISEALERCRDGGVRVVVFTGEGRAFSAGADVKDERPRTPEGQLDLGAGLNQIYNPLILKVRSLPKPVIAAVNGPAVGYSCSLAAACDFIVAAESSYFLLAFVRIGLVPDGGASITIPARVGTGRATELALLGDRVPAREAEAWGLVNEVWPDHEFESRVDALARRLATGPVEAYAEIKALFNRQHLGQLEAQLGAEAAAQYRRGISAEYAEGVRAFREKRPPDFCNARHAVKRSLP